MPSHNLTRIFLSLAFLLILVTTSRAAEPNFTNLDGNVSDQKTGSVLFYNLYASNPANTVLENTRINITNTNDTEGVLLHLFFVDGDSCSVADSYICLSKSQTTTFLTSDVDPGTKGYLLVVAVTSNGRPANFNYLIGDEYVKLASGHYGNLGAESIAVLTTPIHPFSTETNAYLAFDGTYYERLPNLLALSNIPSPADGNSTMVVINLFGGVLDVNGYPLGNLFGILYDQLENGYSFTFSGGCQYRNILSDSFPRTTPRLRQLIPSGQTGWMKFRSTDAYSGTILGASLTLNKSGNVSAFEGAHNLHKLSYTIGGVYVIPVFPGMCN